MPSTRATTPVCTRESISRQRHVQLLAWTASLGFATLIVITAVILVVFANR